MNQLWINVGWIHTFRTNRENSISNRNVDIGSWFDDAVNEIKKGELDTIAQEKVNKPSTYLAATMGLPLTENTASPARAWRNIDNGVNGLTFGVIVWILSTLMAFCRVMVLIGVRYLERDVWGTGNCCSWCAIGVRPLIALIIVRGPGVIVDGIFEVDLLRRRPLSTLFIEAIIDTLWWMDLLLEGAESDPDVMRLRLLASVR